MSDQAVEFLKGWFETKLPIAIPPAPSRDKLNELAHQCEYDAHLAGLTMDELVEEVGALDGLMAIKIENLADEKCVRDVEHARSVSWPG